MRERLKKLWGRLPKLPRRRRIVRNLAISAVLAALAAVLLDWPCLSPYSAFRRLEGAYLLTPSRLVLQVEGIRCDGFLSEGDSWITVGSVTEMDSGGKPLNLDKNYPILHQVLPKEGMVAVIVPVKDEDGGVTAAVWGGPEGAVSGTMELDLSGMYSLGIKSGWRWRLESEVFTARAERREDGWFIFRFVPHDDHPEGLGCAMEALLWGGPMFNSDQLERPYRLTLTDGQGNVVARQEGTFPEDRRLITW